MDGGGEHASVFLITTFYDSGDVVHLPYCDAATKQFLLAHGQYGGPFDPNVTEVRIERMGVKN